MNSVGTRPRDEQAEPARSGPTRVALLGRPESLERLARAVRSYAGAGPATLFVWPAVERFQPPSSTHPPYRGLARKEALAITADRVAAAATLAEDAVRSWTEGQETQIEALLDLNSAAIAARLRESGIGLLISDGDSAFEERVRRAALEAGCLLLLVPPASTETGSRDHGSQGRRHYTSRLLRALHG